MNPDIKKLWVDALRSGNYVQGKSCLRKPSRTDSKVIEHCCLGVLCDLYVKQDTVNGSYWDNSPRDYFVLNEAGQETSAYLPSSVMEWAGLELHNPRVKFKGDHETTLTNLNDNRDHSFKQIADAIEDSL